MSREEPSTETSSDGRKTSLALGSDERNGQEPASASLERIQQLSEMKVLRTTMMKRPTNKREEFFSRI